MPDTSHGMGECSIVMRTADRNVTLAGYSKSHVPADFTSISVIFYLLFDLLTLRRRKPRLTWGRASRHRSENCSPKSNNEID